MTEETTEIERLEDAVDVSAREAGADGAIASPLTSDKPSVYFYSIDVARTYLMILVILASYGLPGEFGSYLSPVFGFSTGTLFALYGFLCLRDSADLKKSIKHTVKVFAILFVVYFILATAYQYVVYGDPFALMSKRAVFNFVVLNYWAPNMGTSIWMVQSVMYSLFILYFLRGATLRKVTCAVLLIFCMAVGEFSGLINFNIFGYTLIPGNFLTRTLPYMLLGYIVYHSRRAMKSSNAKLVTIFLVGIVLCYVEGIILINLGAFVYYAHLFGFIPMTYALVAFVGKRPKAGRNSFFVLKGKNTYKYMYFIYNPIAETLAILILFIAAVNVDLLFPLVSLHGLITLVIVLAISSLFAVFRNGGFKRRRKKVRVAS